MTKLILLYLLVLLVGCAPSPSGTSSNSTVAKLRAKAQAGQTVEPAEIAATAQPVSVQAVPSVVQSSDGLTPDSAGLFSGILFGAALGLPLGYMVAVYVGNRTTPAQPVKAVKRG